MLGNEELWDDILGHLKQRVLVPIVGPELLKVAADGRVITLSRLLGERLAARYGLAIEWTDRSDLNDAVRAFLIARRGESERLYRVINDLLSEVDAEPPEALKQLAAIGDLPLFVSTTFDSLMTRAVNGVRFRGGDARTRELWFSPNQSTLEQQNNARPPADEVVVFKLFGQASSTPQYAIHDEDRLEWLHALLAETARLPDWLGYRLKQDPLLFIGCQIPDWIGRFLVRLASSTRLSITSKQFFIVGTPIWRESSLSEFFDTHCGTTRVQVLEAEPAQFVAELHERWRKRQPQSVAGTATAEAGPSGGSIFISYVREDVVAARRLSDAVSRLGGDVWFDELRLHPGDRWENEILTRMRREARLVVAIISKNTEQREEGYVFKEWAEAVERARGIPRRRFIVPVVIDSDYDGKPETYRQVPEYFRQHNFGHAPGGEPDVALIATLTDEIRAARRRVSA